MAMLGVDIGDMTCFVGAAIGGGIEIITNDVTDRLTPAIVSFRAQDRLIGTSAKSQTIVNYKNTISGIKNLLGRDYADSIVQQEIARLPFSVGQFPNSNKVGIKVNYMDSEQWFTPTQIYAMLLRHIADNAEHTLKSKITSTVLSVPGHFTDIQRRAVIDATKLAGVPSQQLINDGNAIALAYGIYKRDLPEAGQPPRNVAFVDFGHTTLQVSVFALSSGKASCLSCVSCPNLGGRDFDERLFNHFAALFNQKYKVSIQDSKKSCLKLLAECEKLKRLLSANVGSIPMSIECLMEDYDFTARINRAEFEELCTDLLGRIEATLQEAVTLSKIELKDLFSVELVGGSSRVPAVSRIVQKVFSKEVSKTLNFDESVAKGCAIQAALLSPTVLIRKFQIVGVVPYTIRINWSDAETADTGEVEAFKAGSPSNLSKVISFPRKSDFQLECSYKEVEKTFHQNPLVAIFHIKNVRPTEENPLAEVKVKFRIDNSGLLTVPRVDQIEKKMVEIKEEEKPKATLPKDDVDPKNPTVSGADKTENPNTDTAKDGTQPDSKDGTQPDSKDKVDNAADVLEDGKPMEAQADPIPQEASLPPNEKMDITPDTETLEAEQPKQKQYKEVVNKVVLPVVVGARCLTQKEVEDAKEIQGRLISQDRYQADKANSKNALEEFVYEMREKIETDLKDFFTEDEKEKIRTNLEKIDEWLMNDDTQEEPSVYRDHLKTLKQLCEPGMMRSNQLQERTIGFQRLGEAIDYYSKFVTEYRGGREEYQHIEAEEVIKVEKIVDEKRTWLEGQRLVYQNFSRHENPKITGADILAMDKELRNISNPIISKPKPKPIEPPKDATPKEEPSKKDPKAATVEPGQAPAADTQEQPVAKETQETAPPEQSMDLD